MRTPVTMGLLAVVCGCGSHAAPPPASPPPQPVDVRVTVDASREARATIAAATGGTLTVTAADGTAYTLTVPPTALLADTEIAMRPIAGLDGLAATGGAWGGVAFEPEGLRFYDLAPLTVVPPGGGAVHAAVLGYTADGRSIHLLPIELGPATLAIPVLHFSGVAVYWSFENHIQLAPPAIDPADAMAQLEQGLGELVQREREAGDQGSTLASTLYPILRDYYHRAVEPTLSHLATNCATDDAALASAKAWMRLVDLYGAGDLLAQEEAATYAAVLQSLGYCWDEAAKPCIDFADGTQMSKLLGYTRAMELFDPASAASRDPKDPARACDGWHGTASSICPLSSAAGDSRVQRMTATVDWILDKERSDPDIGVKVYGVKLGSVTWELSGTWDGCTYQGGPTVRDLAPGDGDLELHDESAVEMPGTISGIGGVGLAASGAYEPVRYTCTDGRTGSDDYGLGGWFYVIDNPYDPQSSTLTGSFSFTGADFTWSFERTVPR